MNAYFKLKFLKLREEEPNKFNNIFEEYMCQYSTVIRSEKNDIRYFSKKFDLDKTLLSAISEPKTNYDMTDFTRKYGEVSFNNRVVRRDEIENFTEAYNTILNNRKFDSNESKIDVALLIKSLKSSNTSNQNNEINNNAIKSRKRIESIYSPRVDIAFSPIINKSRGKHESVGIYRLDDDVSLFSEIHKLEFVRTLENTIRIESNKNMVKYGLEDSYVGLYDYREGDYTNKRPLHLFGIEIENQKNAKHLMGDFLNALSLSKIPVVVVPKDRIGSLMNMLRFTLTIGELKSVPVYEILKDVSVLTVDQFRDILNELLEEENLPSIGVNKYK